MSTSNEEVDNQDNATLSNQDHVYFKFEGNMTVDSAVMQIPLSSLLVFENTYFARIQDERWTKDKMLGCTKEHPIILHPLKEDFKDVWVPQMSKMIEDYYRFALYNKLPGTLYIPNAVSVEAAKRIMDFYGLGFEFHHLDLKLLDPRKKMNATIYMNEYDHKNDLVFWIERTFADEGFRTMHLLFEPAEITLDLQFTNQDGQLIRNLFYVQYAEKNFQWVNVQECRISFLELLESYHFSAKFLVLTPIRHCQYLLWVTIVDESPKKKSCIEKLCI